MKGTKEHEWHAVERSCPMSCWAAHKWNEPLLLCLSTMGKGVMTRSVLSTFRYHSNMILLSESAAAQRLS